MLNPAVLSTALVIRPADITAPTITSAATANCAENSRLAHALTANEAVTWSIVGGVDQAQFEISSSTLRWSSNGTRNFEAPADTGANNTYVVNIRATDTATPPNTTDQTITITVTDVVTASTFISSHSSTTNLTTYGFTSSTFGVVDDATYATIAIAGQGADFAVSSVALGGVAATLVYAHTAGPGSTSHLEFWIAKLPLGQDGTQSISVVFAGTQNKCAVGVWKVVDLSGTTTTDTAQDGSMSTGVLSGSIDCVAGGMILGAAYNNTGTDWAWTGITERADLAAVENLVFTAASTDFGTTQTGLAVTATQSGAPGSGSNPRLVLVALR